MATADPSARESTADRSLALARAMLDETGVEGLTLRAIARRAGVSHGAPLRHFPTLAALLAAVGAQGFRDLITAVDAHLAALSAEATALERLSASGRAYVHFAIANPGVFTVMFSPDRIDPTTRSTSSPRRTRSSSCRTWSRPRSTTGSTPAWTRPGSRR